MAFQSTPNFSARPNLSSRLSPTQINHHLAPPPQARPSPLVPPPPEPPPEPSQPLFPSSASNPSTSAKPSSKKWSSLFEAKPRNAGSYVPPPLKLLYTGKALQPTDEIFEAARQQWEGYLVGHFLDRPLSYTAVTNHLKKHWQPSGDIKIRSTGTVYFFFIENVEDRDKILRADPLIIQSKLFIIRPWDPKLGDLTKSIKSVPVWIKLTNLPLYSWSQMGISWLAMRVGKFLCMDLSTEKLDRLEFAKCMVEVTPHDELPASFPAMLPDGGEQTVYVTYLWKPEICVKCDTFGHTTVKCSKFAEENVVVAKSLEKARPSVAVQYARDSTNVNSQKPVEFFSKNNARWQMVTNKKKVGFEAQALDKVKEPTRTDNYNMFSALNEVNEDVAGILNESECEEGEIRQVSDLLSRAFGNDVQSKAVYDICTNSIGNNADKLVHMDTTEVKGTLPINNPIAAKQTEDEITRAVKSPVSNNGKTVVDLSNLQLVVDLSSSSEVGEKQGHGAVKLDSFLQNNFDCCYESRAVGREEPKLKAVRSVAHDLSVRDSIAKLRDEIDSGKLDDHVCREKTKLVEIMSKNYNSMESFAVERDKMGSLNNVVKPKLSPQHAFKPGFLNSINKLHGSVATKKGSPSSKMPIPEHAKSTLSEPNFTESTETVQRKPGPYDHILPPPGYKAPPPDSFYNTPINVSTSGRKMGSAPITRSKKIELMKGIDDDKG